MRVTRPEQSILTNALENAPLSLSVIELYPPDIMTAHYVLLRA